MIYIIHTCVFSTPGGSIRDNGLTVPFALTAGLSGVLNTTHLIIVSGLSEIGAGCISMGLGGFLAGESEVEHYDTELKGEFSEIDTVPKTELEEVEDILTNFGIEKSMSTQVALQISRDKNRWAAVYLFAMLGLGLLIATYSATQMQAMSLSFFFINIFNLMSGVFTSVDSMPAWAQALVETFPPSHFIKIMRMVVLKGSGFADIAYHLAAMTVIGIVLNTWAVLNYRKTSA